MGKGLGIGCLVRNTKLQHDLKDLVEYIAYNRVANNIDAGIASVYNDIRKSGIEVDIQTIGHIYNNALPKSYAQFTSDIEVNDFVLKNYSDAIRRAALLESQNVNKEIGQDKPELAIVNGLLNMFYNNMVGDTVTMSDMRKMQDVLWKGIQRKLQIDDKAQPNTREEWKPILEKALGYDKLGMTDVNGHLNSIADLYDSMKRQLEAASWDLVYTADYNDVEKWLDMVDELRASTYSLLFSKGEAKDFITSMMKEAGFGKEVNKTFPDGTKGKDTIIDWYKLSTETNSVQDIRENVENVLAGHGYSQSVIDGVKDSFEQEFFDLHARTLEYKLKELDRREGAIDRVVKSKSDLKRLSELNNLGIFDSSHDKLLNHVVGISDIQQQDLDDIQKLAQSASDLYREIDKKYGSDIFASSALQSIQRSIDRIIQRNINNKTLLLKIVSAVKNFFDIYMTSLLMSPLTITENFLSGIKEIAAPLFLGKAKLSKADRQLYGAILSDVIKRGQSFGEEVGSFAPRELYSNSLQYKWKGATKTELAESILNVIMTPARIGLLGFDSANKAVITNKTFYNSIYTALRQQGKTEQEATEILSEALHGKSLEQAAVDAEQILTNLNKNLPVNARIPINNATITRLANDLVKANLNSDGAVTTDLIESALKGSYHVAGYGLGHEPNNFLSRGVKGIRDASIKKEQSFIENKQWNRLAWQRLKNTYVNSMILRFTGGATNWVVLRAQSGLGLGLLTGFMGHWNSELDFTDKNKMQESITERLNSRNQIGRALTGISYTLLGYGIGYALMAGGGDDREKKNKRIKDLKKLGKLTSVEKEELETLEKGNTWYKQVKNNYEGSRLFKKVAPDLMLLNYYMDTDNNSMLGALHYVQNTSGLGSDFSTSGKIENAMKAVRGGDIDAAKGQLASIAGGSISVPVWRAYKEWYKLGSWIGGNDVTTDFKKPTNFSEGLWGGGMLEDLGVYRRNSNITMLPGIGFKSYEKFKKLGIERMDDLKKNPEWYKATYINEKGNTEYILDKGDREKAKAAAEKWFKEMR